MNIEYANRFAGWNSIYTSIGPSFQTKLFVWLYEAHWIVSSVHDHNCRHATYNEVKALMQGSRIWNEELQRLVTTVVRKRFLFSSAAFPSSTEKVWTSGINQTLHDVAVIDHFWLDGICWFHILEIFWRNSAAQRREPKKIAEFRNERTSIYCSLLAFRSNTKRWCVYVYEVLEPFHQMQQSCRVLCRLQDCRKTSLHRNIV